jgi:AraC-like DNA-binding protein
MKLEFLFVSRLKEGTTVSSHSHKELELVYYAEGEGKLRFGDGPEWDFRPGFFHIAPKACGHTQWNRTELKAICIGVTGSGLEDLSGLWHDSSGLLRYPCERLLSEVSERSLGFEMVSEGLLLEISGLARRVASLPAKTFHRKRKGELVEKALHIIRESGGGTNLDELSDVLFVSKDYLRHLLTRHTGQSPVKLLIEARMERAAKLLREGSPSVLEAAKASGFNDVYYFSRLFKRQFSTSPAAYRDVHSRKMQRP